jgi:hypothetical protein
VPAVAIAVEPVNEDEAFAVRAFSQADEVTLRQAAAKCDQFLKLHLGRGVAGTIGFVRFAQSFSKGEGDGLGHRGYG